MTASSTVRKYKVPRLPNGRIDWQHPKVPRRLRADLRLGLGQLEISRQWGVSVKSITTLVVSLGYDAAPDREVFLADLAHDLNVGLGAVHLLVRRRQIEMRHWGGRRTVPLKIAQELRAEWAAKGQIVPSAPDGYFLTSELALRYRMPVSTLQTRLCRAGVKPTYQLRTRRGLAGLYTAREVEPFTPPVTLTRACPAGHLTTSQLREVTGLSRSGARKWVADGAPHIRGAGIGSPVYWPAEQLAQWVDGRKLEYARRKARPIRRWLAEQQLGRAA